MHLLYPIATPKPCLGVPALLIRPRLRWKDRLNIDSLSTVNVPCGADRAFAAVSTPRESAKEILAVTYGCPTDVLRISYGYPTAPFAISWLVCLHLCAALAS